MSLPIIVLIFISHAFDSHTFDSHAFDSHALCGKLTNPVPCDGYYCRPLVAVSLSLSPIWIWIYFSDQFDVDIFEYNVGYAVLITAVGMSLVVMRYAPGGEGPMDFYMVVSKKQYRVSWQISRIVPLTYSLHPRSSRSFSDTIDTLRLCSGSHMDRLHRQ